MNITPENKVSILFGELINISKGKTISSSIFNIHSFFITETPATYKQFLKNLKNLCDSYQNEIDTLQNDYNINLTDIVRKYVLYDDSKNLIISGIVQNIINIKQLIN